MVRLSLISQFLEEAPPIVFSTITRLIKKVNNSKTVKIAHQTFPTCREVLFQEKLMHSVAFLHFSELANQKETFEVAKYKKYKAVFIKIISITVEDFL